MIEDEFDQITPDVEIIKNSFITWQCSLRQQTLRQSDGRPVSGMCPQVSISKDDFHEQIIVHILKKEPANFIAQFKHIVLKNRSPLERWEAAIETLSTSYYQDPNTFSPRLTALFSGNSSVLKELLEEGQCELSFEQRGRHFEIPCTVFDLAEDGSEFQATYWHNSMFNSKLPANVRVLCFEPIWSQAQGN